MPARPAGRANTRLHSHEAYVRLKEMILTHELTPGQALTEAELAARLGIGRMPVREALQRLAQEDLVTIVPRKGSFVSSIQLDDLQKIFEVRLALECLAARLAAERITADELAAVESLFEETDNISEGSEEHVGIDRAFHRAVAAAAKNEYLARAVDRVFSLGLRLLYLSGSRMSRVGEIVHEYRGVLDALRRRDGDAASRAMQVHIESFRQKVREVI